VFDVDGHEGLGGSAEEAAVVEAAENITLEKKSRPAMSRVAKFFLSKFTKTGTNVPIDYKITH
jgi:hypothetical protein